MIQWNVDHNIYNIRFFKNLVYFYAKQLEKGLFLCNVFVLHVERRLCEFKSLLGLFSRSRSALNNTNPLCFSSDSYTPSTQVMVLHPAAQSPSSQNMQSNQLACVVHGVSNLVEVSWEVSGGVQQKGQTFLLNEDSISLTFVSLLPIPKEVQSRGGKMTCEVRFNSSGTTVKKSTMFNASSSEDHDGKCPPYVMSLAGVGGLALLLLLLSVLWHRFCPSKPSKMLLLPRLLF
nr:PREDICTED: uncharacterized protein LOC107983659 [Anolis carolinensis]|eukprot:XP_016853616.1 PREDICTED: uncharacterized protein LOC107983659 [Anolis carolinensis]